MKNLLFIALIALILTSCGSKSNLEEKQLYQFTLLKRELIKHPEKLKKVDVTVTYTKKVKGKSCFNVTEKLTSDNIGKLKTYLDSGEVMIKIPFKEYGPKYFLEIKRYKENREISLSVWIVNETGGMKLSHHYIYGRSFSMIYPPEYYQITQIERKESEIEALKKARKILKKI
ncbi:MAG: hypothetical protein U9R00_01675 [Patescibacteria group bacterium]|nr:hypothetical protein [Patescibacteria group bacterium]